MEITEVRIKLMDANGDKLRAFCSITIDNDFVIRDLKVIEGSKGPFVAMPSRKLTERCRGCTGKNHYRARYCNECGRELHPERSMGDARGRQKLHADIAHPINQKCRETVQARILEEYEKEVDRRALDPGNYKPIDLDVFDEDSLTDEISVISSDLDEFEPEDARSRLESHLAGHSADPEEDGRDERPPGTAGPVRAHEDAKPPPGSWPRREGRFGQPAGARFAPGQGSRGGSDRGFRQGRGRPEGRRDGGREGRGGSGGAYPQGRSDRREPHSRDRRPERGGAWRGPGDGRRRDDGYRGARPAGSPRPEGEERRGYPRGPTEAAERPERSVAPAQEREIDERMRAPISFADLGPAGLARDPPEKPRVLPALDEPPEDNFGVGLIS